ncbi:type I-E CRISPR-associated protein Cse1/CasA [Antarctobacter sp.]|uniref:type I-E CRISPR-associated protein Cse1/CasA n=1 Tax=Antarctobacter sp. TaxID=1872577 RepID=UPI003A90880A
MLNLIYDSWIPVRTADGSHRVIAPWQMAEADVVGPDWPRADMNIACLELLIGLVFLADPPTDTEDWQARGAPDPERLRVKLSAYASAFNLVGDGPLFLQDQGPLDGAGNPVDMLFIDSAGVNTARNNADVLVHRGRYPALELPLAAMALYTFQAFAPSGGAGNRTSMRGGGPLVTLIEPREAEGPLWELVWANVPDGKPGRLEDLPWMRPTVLSDKSGKVRYPPDRLFDVEAFFGMPRRLRLETEEAAVVGVVQKPWGTNYAGWKHPLSPYYRLKEGAEWLPKHPRAGRFGFRNWLGVLAQVRQDTLTELALSLSVWGERRGDGSVIVAGWSMDNMKPREFVLSKQPFLDLDWDAEDVLVGLIRAADAASAALRDALSPVLSKGEARETERERFYVETENRFLEHLDTVKGGGNPSAVWLDDLRKQAFRQFDVLSVPGIDQRDMPAIKRIVDARKYLGMAFAGYGKQGRAIFEALGLDLPVKKKGQAV